MNVKLVSIRQQVEDIHRFRSYPRVKMHIQATSYTTQDILPVIMKTLLKITNRVYCSATQ